MLSVEGDVPVDSGAPMVTSSISRICRLSLSEVLIGVGLRACIHKDECACVFVNACVCTVFLKKKSTEESELFSTEESELRKHGFARLFSRKLI